MLKYQSCVVFFFFFSPAAANKYTKDNTDFSEPLFRLMEQTCVTEKSHKRAAQKKDRKMRGFNKRLLAHTSEIKRFLNWEWGAWVNIRVCGGSRYARPQLTLASVGLSAPSSKQRQSGLGKLASLSSRYTANQLTQQLASIARHNINKAQQNKHHRQTQAG